MYPMIMKMKKKKIVTSHDEKNNNNRELVPFAAKILRFV